MGVEYESTYKLLGKKLTRRKLVIGAVGAAALSALAIVGIRCTGEGAEQSTPTPVVTQPATPETPVPTTTPEWFDFYPGIPGRNFQVEDKLHKNPNPDGTFFIDELLVTFQPGLPEQRIAEIVAEINGEVWAYSGGLNTFTLGVNPEEREVILAQLSSNTEIVNASRSDILKGTNGE